MQLRQADKFRDAINTGSPGEAEQVLEALRIEVEASWRAATSTVERSAISSEVTGLLEWARQTIVVRRAHAQTRLSRLTRQNAYAPKSPRRLAIVEIEG